jgi:hypothetical protein
VFTAESLTTPVRNMFDASFPQSLPGKGTKSTGTDPFIPRRFRQKPIVVVADIRNALKTIGVMDEDRNFQKFPWWEHKWPKTFKVYQRCRVLSHQQTIH